MAPELQALQDANILKAIQDGPRMRRDYSQFVVARNRASGGVLLGGLGALGVGQMWFNDRGQYDELPGFADAPEMERIE